MTDKAQPNPIRLRSYLGKGAGLQEGPNKQNNVSFSPDIIPFLDTKIKDPLGFELTYNDFIALPMDVNVQNHIYIRGKVDDETKPAHALVLVSEVANELVPWPRVLNAAKPLGLIPLKFDPKEDFSDAFEETNPYAVHGVVSSAKCVKYSPPERGGRFSSLIARDISQLPRFPKPSISDIPLIPEAKNWKDLLSIVGADNNMSLYNVAVVDPIFEVYSHSSRLRFFNDDVKPVTVDIEVETAGIPEGYEFSLYSENNELKIARTKIIDGQSFGTSIDVDNKGVDIPITIQIFNAGGSLLPDKSSISIVVHVQEKLPHHQIDDHVLGAEHIVFSTSHKRVRAMNHPQFNTADVDFWFRTNIGDTNYFPRQEEQAWYSPDIQPTGQLRYESDDDAQEALGGTNYMVDTSSVGVLRSELNNYVYLRAMCNKAVNYTTILNCVPNAVLLDPTQWSQYPVRDPSTGQPAQLPMTSDGPGVVVSGAYNVSDPPRPPSGSNHYCLIAEAKDDPYAPWPHENAPTSSTDLHNWMLNNAYACQRNIAFKKYSGESYEGWITNLYLPTYFSPSEQFHLQLSWAPAQNLVGNTLEMKTNGSVSQFNIDQFTVTDGMKSVNTQDVTGIQTPYSTTLTINWTRGSGNPMSPNTEISVDIVKTDAASNFVEVEKLAKIKVNPNDVALHVLPGFPNLIKDGASLRKGRFEHLNGKALVGKALPFPQYPRTGAFTHKELSDLHHPILQDIVLGADKLRYQN